MLGGKLESIEGISERNRRPWNPDIQVIKAVIAFMIEMLRCDVQRAKLFHVVKLSLSHVLLLMLRVTFSGTL